MSIKGGLAVKARRGIGWRVRGLVMARAYFAPIDAFVCALCCGRMTESDVVIDHIMPVALGGDDDARNLQAVCRVCNAVKSDRHPDDDFEHLIWAAHGDPEYV